MGHCNPGLKLTRSLIVDDEHTALSLGSGDVPAVATPELLLLAEQACIEAIAGELESQETSVGAWAEIEHLKATPVGSKVVAQATLIGHHGRRLEFSVLIEHNGETVAKVRHRRVVVERERFLEKLGAPQQTDQPVVS